MILCRLRKKLNMSAPVDSTNPNQPDFAQSLLNLAQWLDSQNTEYRILNARNAKVNLCVYFVSRKEWEQTMYMQYGGEYYHLNTTNSERVLAVLMLREMILNGDA
jgi:hypothetical protein